MENDLNKEVIVTMPQLVDAYNSLIEEAQIQESQGWGDEDKCTYHEGYISQPVYACVTCTDKNNNMNGEVFGFCFGCSMSCHLDHEIYELFHKRNFRCDCATPKSVHLCTLNPKLDTVNALNQYNHNFRGLYCWCSTPYDHNSNVVMIQCYMCQDWFHDTCILKDFPHNTIPEEPDTDFICKDCISKYQSFLGKYKDFEYIELDESEEAEKTEPKSIPQVPEVKLQIEQQQNECLISNVSSTNILRAGNYFFRPGWREKLCRCRKCLNMYQLIDVNYLIKAEEKIPESAPETPPPAAKKPELEEPSLSRQREIAYGLMEFRDNLMEFLKPFAAQKRTVTAADIEQFKEQFENQKQKKKKI